jgi:tRNA A37 threonylcarbamoyladenosine dehydratase
MSFARLQDQLTPEQYNALQSKTVLIIGLGGVGGHAAESIARSAFGTIVLVDHDDVSASNINRQIVALESTIGQRKIDIMKDRIHDINPSCSVITHHLFYDYDTKEDIFHQPIDYIIDCIDTITYKIDVIIEAEKRNIPIISVMGTGNKFQPEKLQIMPLSKTAYDPIARVLRQKLRDKVDMKKVPVVLSTEVPIKRDVPYPTSNAFVPSSAGILAASYIFRHAIGQAPPL